MSARRAVGAAALLLAMGFAAPAAASTLNPFDIGAIFCAGRISGDMSEVLPLLTAELAAMIATAGGADAVPWQDPPGPVTMCMPVGAQGSAVSPEAVLSLSGPGGGFANSLVFRFVDDQLRIDDVRFPDGSTLRGRLAGGK
jgi:hypothetical protein